MRYVSTPALPRCGGRLAAAAAGDAPVDGDRPRHELTRCGAAQRFRFDNLRIDPTRHAPFVQRRRAVRCRQLQRKRIRLRRRLHARRVWNRRRHVQGDRASRGPAGSGACACSRDGEGSDARVADLLAEAGEGGAAADAPPRRRRRRGAGTEMHAFDGEPRHAVARAAEREDAGDVGQLARGQPVMKITRPARIERIGHAHRVAAVLRERVNQQRVAHLPRAVVVRRHVAPLASNTVTVESTREPIGVPSARTRSADPLSPRTRNDRHPRRAAAQPFTVIGSVITCAPSGVSFISDSSSSGSRPTANVRSAVVPSGVRTRNPCVPGSTLSGTVISTISSVLFAISVISAAVDPFDAPDLDAPLVPPAHDLPADARVIEQHRIRFDQILTIHGDGRRLAALHAVLTQLDDRRRPHLRPRADVVDHARRATARCSRAREPRNNADGDSQARQVGRMVSAHGRAAFPVAFVAFARCRWPQRAATTLAVLSRRRRCRRCRRSVRRRAARRRATSRGPAPSPAASPARAFPCPSPPPRF